MPVAVLYRRSDPAQASEKEGLQSSEIWCYASQILAKTLKAQPETAESRPSILHPGLNEG